MQDLAYVPSLLLVLASTFAAGNFAIEGRLDTGWSGTSLPSIAHVYPERWPVGEGTFSGWRKYSHARICGLMMVYISQLQRML